MICFDEIVALGFGNGCEVFVPGSMSNSGSEGRGREGREKMRHVPCFWEEVRRAILIEESQFAELELDRELGTWNG